MSIEIGLFTPLRSPVTKLASSLQRYRHALAMSDGSPRRPIGVSFSRAATQRSLSTTEPLIDVLM